MVIFDLHPLILLKRQVNEDMKCQYILFDEKGRAIDPAKIKRAISGFPDSYKEASHKAITESVKLTSDGKAFLRSAKYLLLKFGMGRSGPFRPEKIDEGLNKCWDAIGDQLIEVRKRIPSNGPSRDRYLLTLKDAERVELIEHVWRMMKQILPFTMGDSSFGLVGASKVLFSVLPEIVLPVDNRQWLVVFQNVDMSDVIKWMVSDIKRWEEETHSKLNEMDSTTEFVKVKRLTTLPSVYNVMAMKARYKLLL